MRRIDVGRAVAAALVILLAVGWILGASPATAQTLRKSITDLTPSEIMALRQGVATMKARDTAPRNSAEFRRSWVYWANMHGHFGGECRGPVSGSGMEGLKAWTASNANERATWCKCQHGSANFTTWHRMYIYYFERVLRQAANDPNLTLPYWDYATDPQLPQAFRDETYVNAEGQVVPNPLRAEARRPQLNSGAAGIGAGTSSAANAMAATNFNTFRQRLESGPHGAVHCAVSSGGCPTGLMGFVPAAANDPIFYLHHANIDRLYECWLGVDPAGRLPTGNGVLNARFSFVDETGAVVARRVRDMLTTAQLGYSYAGGSSCPAPAAMEELVLADASGDGMTELTRGVTVAPLEVRDQRAEAALEGAARSANAEGMRATVFVAGLEAEQVPGVIYNVYLANDAGERAQIGVIDFFGFMAGGPEAEGHAGHGGHDSTRRRFQFDATEAMERLGLDAEAPLNLVFEPTTGLDDSTVEQAVEAIPRDAQVRFRRAWLRVR